MAELDREAELVTKASDTPYQFLFVLNNVSWRELMKMGAEEGAELDA